MPRVLTGYGVYVEGTDTDVTPHKVRSVFFRPPMKGEKACVIPELRGDWERAHAYEVFQQLVRLEQDRVDWEAANPYLEILLRVRHGSWDLIGFELREYVRPEPRTSLLQRLHAHISKAVHEHLPARTAGEYVQLLALIFQHPGWWVAHRKKPMFEKDQLVLEREGEWSLVLHRVHHSTGSRTAVWGKYVYDRWVPQSVVASKDAELRGVAARARVRR